MFSIKIWAIISEIFKLPLCRAFYALSFLITEVRVIFKNLWWAILHLNGRISVHFYENKTLHKSDTTIWMNWSLGRAYFLENDSYNGYSLVRKNIATLSNNANDHGAVGALLWVETDFSWRRYCYESMKMK